MAINGAGVARALSTMQDVVLGQSAFQASEEARPNEAISSARWTPIQRIAFRWATIYIVLYCFPFPAGALPGLDWAESLWLDFWQDSVVPWIGLHALQWEVQFVPNGSGDTAFHWVQLFAYFTLATAGTLVWSILDRSRLQYARLFAWLYLYVRYDLAWEMLRYGLHKVFALQFVTGPTLSRMLETYGESSPFALASTFMASSTTYLVFAGVAETVGGTLLLFRGLTTLGALIVVPVMTNAVLMNFCYDIPVKIHSSHVLVLAVFLLVPEARRLTRAIVLGKSVEGAEAPAPAPQGRARALRGVLKLAVVAGLVVPQVLMNRALAANFAIRHPLYGIYEPGSDAVPADVRAVIVDEVKVLAIQRASGALVRFQIARSSEPGSLTLAPYRRAGQKAKLAFKSSEDGLLTLSGAIEGEPFDLRLHKVPTPPFVLQTRGFRWINDNAFDR
jgi:uncharacterized membrane protein YphA (DoxX/SURF4 family)